MVRPSSTPDARALYAAKDWGGAFSAFNEAAADLPLEAKDLERLAVCAYLLDDASGFVASMERAHLRHISDGAELPAVRCAFWIGLTLALRGEVGKASGWLSRASRILKQQPGPSVEEGYLALPQVQGCLAAGDVAAALGHARRAVAVGQAFGEADLIALGAHLEGRIEVTRGNVSVGLSLLDEAMVAVTGGELSPIVTGIIYCNVIEGCQEVFALDRSAEWTQALSDWCAGQPTLVAFTGKCLVHRAEVMCLNGQWEGAADEADRASSRLADTGDGAAAGAATYQRGELYRMRGMEADAEQAYARANTLGREPQPGLSLLRLAQGQVDRAVAGIERAVPGEGPSLSHAKHLEACVEIMLAIGRKDAAATATERLRLTAERYGTQALVAMASGAEGLLRLDDGDADGAVALLRESLSAWQKTQAPFAGARVRISLGSAYRLLGDLDGCTMQWDAARAALETLGAHPELSRLGRLAGQGGPNPSGLTDREVEVLRWVAAGKTNREVAATLHLAVKTIDRHLSNIFRKTGASSRAAATAFAYKQKLL